jgi:hypothetical protein
LQLAQQQKQSPLEEISKPEKTEHIYDQLRQTKAMHNNYLSIQSHNMQKIIL